MSRAEEAGSGPVRRGDCVMNADASSAGVAPLLCGWPAPPGVPFSGGVHNILEREPSIPVIRGVLAGVATDASDALSSASFWRGLNMCADAEGGAAEKEAGSSPALEKPVFAEEAEGRHPALPNRVRLQPSCVGPQPMSPKMIGCAPKLCAPKRRDHTKGFDEL